MIKFGYNDKMAFYAEWTDYDVLYRKRFILNYYPSDNTLELYDRDLNRIYLKRLKFDDLHMEDMFVGNSIKIYGRQVAITDYADERTEKIVGKSKEHTFALLKPSVIEKLGEIITEIQQRNFHICNMKMCNLNRKQVLELYESNQTDNYLPFVMDHLISGPVVAMELVGENAVEHWRDVLGPNDPVSGKQVAPNSLRALYGNDSVVENGFHGAKDTAMVLRELAFFFPRDKTRKPPVSSLVMTNTTCCVIKPHAIAEGKLGVILSAIDQAKFQVSGLQMFYLNNANADEFLEVYKGVVSDYHALLSSFVDGPCVALEISAKCKEMEDVHQDFRMFCGPADPDIARQIRPTTLRARFGCDKYRNAVHCTDLKEDTELDLNYFFGILND